MFVYVCFYLLLLLLTRPPNQIISVQFHKKANMQCPGLHCKFFERGKNCYYSIKLFYVAKKNYFVLMLYTQIDYFFFLNTYYHQYDYMSTPNFDFFLNKLKIIRNCDKLIIKSIKKGCINNV